MEFLGYNYGLGVAHFTFFYLYCRWYYENMAMQFNDEELSLVAQGPPHIFSKQGLLFTRPIKKLQKKSKAVKPGNGELHFHMTIAVMQ